MTTAPPPRPDASGADLAVALSPRHGCGEGEPQIDALALDEAGLQGVVREGECPFAAVSSANGAVGEVQVVDRVAGGLEEGGLPFPEVAVRVAPNPFDHLTLLRRGIGEWASGPDAAIAGRRFPVLALERLFLEGLGSGAFDLVLIHLGIVGDAETKLPPLLREEDARLDRQREDASDERLAVFESVVDGVERKPNVHKDLLSPASILGFDIVSRDDRGWLQAHLLFIKPEYRGRDLARRAYFPAVIRFAYEQGYRGFRFLSTLERWKSVTFLHSEPYLRQNGGPDVVAYWKAVR